MSMNIGSFTKELIPRNNGTNWPDYKQIICALAFRSDALGILDGSKRHPLLPKTTDLQGQNPVFPPAVLPNNAGDADVVKAVAEYEKARNELAFMVLSSQSPTTQPLVRTSTKPGDVYTMWKALTDYYEPHTRSSIKGYFRQLLNLKQAGRSVTEFLSELDLIKNQLDSALSVSNLNPLEVIVQSIMIDGLDERYNVLAQQVFLNNDLDLDAARLAILQGSQRIDQEDSHQGATITALKVGGEQAT